MSDEPKHDSAESSADIGKWMIIALWLLIMGFGTFFAQKWFDKRDRGQTPVNISGVDGRLSVELKSDRAGHYLVEGLVNGSPVAFLVDTGATGVSIPGKVAERLDLEPGYEFPVTTANGSIMVQSTRLNQLSIGQLALDNVSASINLSMEGEVGLLGMSFLRHFELVQRDGFLTIREP